MEATHPSACPPFRNYYLNFGLCLSIGAHTPHFGNFSIFDGCNLLCLFNLTSKEKDLYRDFDIFDFLFCWLSYALDDRFTEKHSRISKKYERFQMIQLAGGSGFIGSRLAGLFSEEEFQIFDKNPSCSVSK